MPNHPAVDGSQLATGTVPDSQRWHSALAHLLGRLSGSSLEVSISLSLASFCSSRKENLGLII